MDRLTPLDVSFLHIEDADHTAHMHIASVGIFEGPIPPQHEVTEALLDRLHLVPRYRQRIQTVPFELARPVWVDAEDFDIDYHVRRTALSAPGSEDDLRVLFGRVMSQRLDRSKPLWEIWVVEGLAGGQWAMISKVHHCMVDGVSGTEVMGALLDHSPEPSSYERVAWTPTLVTEGEVTRDAMWSLATDSAEQLRAVRSAIRRPVNLVQQVRDVVGGALSMSRSLQPQPETGLTGPVGSHRVVAWTHGSLADVKAVRAALGGTVNDVVLTAITNGFRELLLARGETVDGRVVRTLVPVSVRTKRDDGAATGDGTMSNKISAMFAKLPVGIADPAERLASISAQLGELKESKQATTAEVLISLSATAPAALMSWGARVAARASAGPAPLDTLTTNVPGPPTALYAHGRRLIRSYPYAPLGAQGRTAVSIFSYDGEVTFGVTGDRDSAPDIDILARGISDGLAELVALSVPAEPPKATTSPRTPRKAATPKTRARKAAAR